MSARLTATQADTLRVLEGNGSRTGAEVGRQLLVSHSIAHGRLRGLWNKSLVKWQLQPVGYVLTPAGRDALARYDAEQVP